jgi:hypothetical protein
VSASDFLSRHHRATVDKSDVGHSGEQASQPRKRPDPSVLRLSIARDGDVLDRVCHELDVPREEGARPKDIVVFSLTGRETSRLVELDTIGSHRVALADAAECAGLSSIRSSDSKATIDRSSVITQNRPLVITCDPATFSKSF